MIPLSQLEEFNKSMLWGEIRTIFLQRLSAVRDDLEDPNATEKSDWINKGRAEELRFASEVVNSLMDEIREDRNQEADRKEMEGEVTEEEE